ATPRRLRDDQHLAFVAHLPCLICGRAPSHAHHLRFAQPRALGQKVSDEWVVPLCNLHHRALHGIGNEETWWAQHSIDALAEAQRLWRERSSSLSEVEPVQRELVESGRILGSPARPVDSALPFTPSLGDADGR